MFRFLVPTSLFALLWMPAPAEAQLMKKIREKAKATIADRTTETNGKDAAQASPTQIYNEHVLVMTPEVLDRFARALDAEGATREGVAETIRSLPGQRKAQAEARASGHANESEWRKCTKEVLDRPEYKKRFDGHQASMIAMSEQVKAGKMDPQAMRQAMMEKQAALAALNEEIAETAVKECGAEPDSGGAAPGSLPDEGQLRRKPVETALQAGGFSEIQYSILKERVMPFCGAAASAGADGGAGGGVSIPGADNKFYVYDRAEVEALGPRCGALMRGLEAVL